MNARLSPEREAEIAARAEAATPGPWEANAEYGAHFYAYVGGPYLLGVGTLNFGEGTAAEADKALTVNAREDIRELLAELAAVRAERDQAETRVRKQIADDLHRAELPSFPRGERPELAAKTVRSVDVRIASWGDTAPYWVPKDGA